MQKFWMVMGLNSPQTSKRHYDYLKAVKEAERLVKQERKIFFLLEAVGYCSPKEIPVEWANYFEQPRITIEEAGKDNHES